MTRDPIGYAGGENLYGYCEQDPVGGLDPSGLDCGGGSWLGIESAPPPGGATWWDLVPFIGSGRDIYYGIENGDGLRFGLGVGGMIADVFTLGADFAEKDAGEIAIKEAAQITLNHEAGMAGEAAAGIAKKTAHIASMTRPGSDRIPDYLNQLTRTMAEVKNVRYQAYTSQLRDYVAIAKDKGFRFVLMVRPETTLSGPLKEAVRGGDIVLGRTLR